MKQYKQRTVCGDYAPLSPQRAWPEASCSELTGYMNGCQSFLSSCILPQKVNLVNTAALSPESFLDARHH